MNLIDAERTARAIIAGQDARPAEALKLEQVLRAARRFGLGRRVLARCAGDPNLLQDPALRRTIAQKRALCTYKDPDLADDSKLDEALHILAQGDDLQTTTDQETLGLAGAIYKRKWEQTAQERQLETALAYYFRGYQQAVVNDYGYTAINAAFVLDSLAEQQSVAGQSGAAVSASAQQRRSLATTIRSEIVAILAPLPSQPGNEWLAEKWWFLVTVGEAFFGLEDFANAKSWLMRAATLPDVPDWERESTARQIAALLLMKERVSARAAIQFDDAARRLLQEFLGDNVAALDSVLRGKVGLALSGGGFRAAFYHVGVLAKLAELDLLRHVEYLSCVSGGSIIGAHFYLEVKKLLEEVPNRQIGRQHYIEIVRRLEIDFFEGVKSNVRTRIAAEWLTNLKLIFLPSYSRTMRAGELYESEIYARVQDGNGDRPRWLNELKIQPKGEPAGLSPKDQNWRLAAKVPILVLNATALNTGHNWQFTASWMGEPPAGINSEVDANYRLRRLYYTEAPEPHNRIRLGHAVAASACVPGIFEPLALPNLYERTPPGKPSRISPMVRLVDGGVHDNQGVAALLEQGCTVMLVSDASGQMSDSDFPSNGLLGVPLRSNSILQARVRVSQFDDLADRRRSGLLRGLMFVHLKKGLETIPVDWRECQDPSPSPNVGPLLPYGVQRHVQRRLAAIRTDLDSFSQTEACALMASGYLMTEYSLRDPILGFPVAPQPREPWKFLAVETLLQDRRLDSPFVRQLEVAGTLFFKVWMLVRQLQIAAGVLAVALLGVLVWSAWTWREHAIYTLTVKSLFGAAVSAGLALAGLGVVAKVLSYRKTATDILIGLGTATIGFLLARLHLHVFDKLFLRYGRLDRLLDPTKEELRPDGSNDRAA